MSIARWGGERCAPPHLFHEAQGRESMVRMLLRWWGPLLVLFLAVRFGCYYSSRWEFGRLGMPSSLLANDGKHYADGAEVDDVTLMIIRSGREQEFNLGIAFVVFGCFGWLGFAARRLYGTQMRVFQGNLRTAIDLGYTLPKECQGAYFRSVFKAYGVPMTESEEEKLLGDK